MEPQMNADARRFNRKSQFIDRKFKGGLLIALEISKEISIVSPEFPSRCSDP
jgi:hypothetical protein